MHTHITSGDCTVRTHITSGGCTVRTHITSGDCTVHTHITSGDCTVRTHIISGDCVIGRKKSMQNRGERLLERMNERVDLREFPLHKLMYTNMNQWYIAMKYEAGKYTLTVSLSSLERLLHSCTTCSLCSDRQKPSIIIIIIK